MGGCDVMGCTNRGRWLYVDRARPGSVGWKLCDYHVTTDERGKEATLIDAAKLNMCPDEGRG